MGDPRDPQLPDSAELIADLRQELEDTNRGLIALHTELDAARRSEARLAAIVTSSDDAVISVDPGPAYLLQTWNPGAQRLFGHTDRHILGRPVDLLMPPDALGAFRAAVQDVRSQGHTAPHRSRWRREDGTEVDVEVTVSAVRETDGVLIGFSTVARDITQQLSAQAELTAARAEREVMADRDRIARDLHDLVIQRLFASGLTLQAALSRMAGPKDSAERIERVVGDLDDTIKTIRTTIYGLREQDQIRSAAGTRSRLVAIVERAAEVLGFAPALRMSGLLDTDVPAEHAEHLLAVLGEALSNSARHADATAVDVNVEAGGGILRLEVADNGCGIDPAVTRRSGLANLRRRAEERGGTFALTPNRPTGTVLVWSVPLPGDHG
ncbi:PAS domain-containing sensor histidine kinase [Streptomyces cylindrosporus]|uniref:PAS domain-containing sensor histidine kinase n=1 Tax=Streptomyces cylindrosporus TaxID=2927583 RepID=A0ABS9YM90_9ACTN|nr:PAS domain-containing sensor histidine kinase [Streptomyces cylindrosporus]MCI3278304.1 PAS domain-containing sensor histidine kinase [Streptomyces cylindrosporus]